MLEYIKIKLLELFTPWRSNIMYFMFDDRGDLMFEADMDQFNYELPVEENVYLQTVLKFPGDTFGDWLREQRGFMKSRVKYQVTFLVSPIGEVKFDENSFKVSLASTPRSL